MSGSLSNSPNDLLPTYSQRSRQRINRPASHHVCRVTILLCESREPRSSHPRRAPRRAHVRESRK
jgi:hypothetical protein